MRLHPTDVPPKRDGVEIIRSPSGLLFFVGLIVAATGATGLWLVAVQIEDIPGLMWVVLGPMLLFGVPIWGVLCAHMFSAWFAGGRPTNWVMTVAQDGVCLNLRHMMNWKREPAEDTIVSLALAEITSARHVKTLKIAPASDEDTTVGYHNFLELSVAEDVSAQIKEAVHRELGREGATTEVLGVKSTSKANGSLVTVPRPGVVRVAWTGDEMTDALKKVGVDVQPFEEIDEQIDPKDLAQVEDEILSMIERGQKVQAIVLARQAYGYSLIEAREFVEGLIGEAA